MFKRYFIRFIASLSILFLFACPAFPGTYGQQVEFLLSQVRDSATGSLAGGTVTFYAAGTTNLKDIYLDRAKATPAANPYTLDANGTAQLYADGLYKVVVKNAAGATIYTRDNLSFNWQSGTVFEVDALETYGGGTSFTKATIDTALTALGTTNKTTLLLRPGTWVINANADWSAYSNVIFKIAPGAIISHGAYTVNIPNPDTNMPIADWLSGAGAVTISGTSVVLQPLATGFTATGGTTRKTLTVGTAADIEAGAAGFTIAGGTTSKTLTVGTDANVQTAAAGFTLAGGTVSKTLTVPLDATVSGTHTGTSSGTNTGDGQFKVVSYSGAYARAVNASSGDVSYTGAGFTPKAVQVFAYTWKTGAYSGDMRSYNSIGMSSGVGADECMYSVTDATGHTITRGTTKVAYIANAVGGAADSQVAIMKSFDADGMTLTWTNTVNTGWAGDLDGIIMAVKYMR